MAGLRVGTGEQVGQRSQVIGMVCKVLLQGRREWLDLKSEQLCNV